LALSKVLAVQDSVFYRIVVVGLAASGLEETKLLVEGSGRGIGLTYLKKHGMAAGLSCAREKLCHEVCADALPAGFGGDHDVFEFPLIGEVAGNEESDYCGCPVASFPGNVTLGDEYESWNLAFVSLKQASVLRLAPMRSSRRVALEAQHVGNMLMGCGVDDDGVVDAQGVVSLEVSGWFRKYLCVGAADVVRVQLLG